VQKAAQFATGSGFAGAVETDHQDATWIATELNGGIGRAKEFDEFVVDNFNDVLAGLNAEKDFLTDRLVLDALNEIASDLEINVGFQEGQTDFAEGIADVFLRNFTEATQVFEGFLKLGA
jgi:hypothetical protein